VQEPGAVEFGEDAAEVSGVEAEGVGDLASAGRGAGGEFVEDAGFGEAEGGIEQAFVEGARCSGCTCG
jgi:hypothetical protein